MLRIAHIADPHLGFSAYGKRDKVTNINIREQDFYNAFITAIDKVKELQTDILIIAGDLFDSSRPPSRAIILAQMLLSTLNIFVLVIAGNHDNATSVNPSPLLVLSPFSNIKYVENPEVVTILEHTFYCVPFREDPFEYKSADYLVGHVRDNRILAFKKSKICLKDSPYKICMLGDYHIKTVLEPNIFYPGSLERSSFNQLNSNCGFYFYSDGTAESAEFITIPTRPFIELTSPPDDLESLRNAVVRCRLTNGSDLSWVSEVKKVALHTSIYVEKSPVEKVVQGDLKLEQPKISSLLDQFESFCNANRMNYPDDVIDLARSSLKSCIEEADHAA